MMSVVNVVDFSGSSNTHQQSNHAMCHEAEVNAVSLWSFDGFRLSHLLPDFSSQIPSELFNLSFALPIDPSLY
jgi:hypothetical protein